jgi:hypothetical protein
MRQIKFKEFRTKLDEQFSTFTNVNSVAYQLIDLTDLFQKIAAIYRYAQNHSNTSFQNPIIYQLVESSLFYGVCVQIRRLADGGQPNEISLFRIVKELQSNSKNWTRHDFVTWDGTPYDATPLRLEYQTEIDRLTRENLENGVSTLWVPTGGHETIEYRHKIYDVLSGVEEI